MTSLANQSVSLDDRTTVVRINARLNVGGIARHVAWLTSGLHDKGYPSVLVAGVVPAGEEDMIDFVERQGVQPLILPEMSREISPKDVLTVWKLYRLFTRLRPELVHTHAAKAGAVGRLAALLYRWLTPGTLIGRPRPCRVVHTYHGHIFHSYYGRLKTRFFLTIERLLARFATDRVITISPQQFREINETFRVGRAEQFSVIRLGIDLDSFAAWQSRRQASRELLGAAPSDVLVGIIGRLTEIKNLPMFLRVAAHCKKTAQPSGGPRLRFVVIGGGHLRAELERQAAELGVTDAVVFLGSRDDPEMFYPGLDVVALTSLNEGTPVTLLEGMANARPVIATNVGGVVDLVGSPQKDSQAAHAGYAVCERGLLVPSQDVEAFARGLLRLVGDADLRRDLGERGLAFVHATYSKERLLCDIANLYDQLLGRERDRSDQALTNQLSASLT